MHNASVVWQYHKVFWLIKDISARNGERKRKENELDEKGEDNSKEWTEWTLYEID